MKRLPLVALIMALCLVALGTDYTRAFPGTPVPTEKKPKDGGNGSSRVPIRYPLYLELEDEGDTDSLIFYYQGMESVSYSIYSEDGELLLQGSCLFDSYGKCQVPLDGLAPGTYTITIMVGGTMYEGTFLFG